MGRPLFCAAEGHAKRTPTAHLLPCGTKTQGNKRQGSGLLAYPNFSWIAQRPLSPRKIHDPFFE